MNRRLLALLLLALAGLTACGRMASTQPATGGYRLFLEEGYSNGAQQITVRDAGTGAVERILPLGTAAPDWSRYYTITQLAGNSRLSAIDPASGRTIAQRTIPAGFALPTLGYLGPTAGLSPNGAWLTLTDNSRATTGKLVTTFLVGASSLSGSFKTVRVDGDISFDALSNDGKSLYLIQKMGDPNHYQVRLYDVEGGLLAPQPVVDKRESNEPMNGIRGDSVADPTGNYVYTVYVRDGGPFIHALPLGVPFAWCVDLPSKTPNDMALQFFWSLAISHDGRTVYAANTSLGTVAVMTAGEPPQIARTGQTALRGTGPLFAGLITDAAAKGPRIGGAALSVDGRTLFALGETGILAIDTASLKVQSRFLTGQSIESIRMSSDGRWLYAAEAASSIVLQIDPATRAVHSELKGVTNPWALLWAAPK